jgi:uncharacterized protein YbjT (DUF2867 family)
MNILLLGASGMVGKGVLMECLEHADVDRVMCLVRKPLDMSHAKLVQVVHDDFLAYDAVSEALVDVDACFWCLGTTSVGKSEEEYRRITYDYTLAGARAVLEASPQCHFAYVSGQGTDGTERGRSMWARVKGKTENDLLAMPFASATMFRPGVILGRKGAKPREPWIRAFYWLVLLFYPLLRLLGQATSTTEIGLAMINAGKGLSRKRVLEVRDINELARLQKSDPGSSGR